MTDEIWKDIEGYEGLYLVSNKGNILNIKRGRKLKLCTDGAGYAFVCLSKGGIKSNPVVHRLVAKAFIPNPLNLPQVNHKDEDKMNPAADNLEWCTAQQNIEYSNKVEFTFIDPTGSVVSVTNLSRLSREYSLNVAAMHRVHSGKRNHHKGWRKYVPVNV